MAPFHGRHPAVLRSIWVIALRQLCCVAAPVKGPGAARGAVLLHQRDLAVLLLRLPDRRRDGKNALGGIVALSRALVAAALDDAIALGAELRPEQAPQGRRGSDEIVHRGILGQGRRREQHPGPLQVPRLHPGRVLGQRREGSQLQPLLHQAASVLGKAHGRLQPGEVRRAGPADRGKAAGLADAAEIFLQFKRNLP